MFKNKIHLSLVTVATILSVNAYAQSTNHHVVIAPECLIKNYQGEYKSLAAKNNLRLISVDDLGINQLIDVKNKSKTLCGGFIDVTHQWNKFSVNGNAASFLAKHERSTHFYAILPKKAYAIKYPEQVAQLISQINPQEMWGFLTNLTSYQDRYANSKTGVEAADWLKTQVETFAKENNRNDVTVWIVKTGEYSQPSIVAKVGTDSGPGIVVGAHMDTLSADFSKKPGADDDGTGSVTVLETAKTVLASGLHFKKPIYFIWYAAEEEGLVGSSYVVDVFINNQIPVDAVLHFDLTGYAYKKEPTMWLIDDYVDKNLSAYLGKLIETYVKKPVKHTRCGYACSDHASWTQAGYSAAIPAESAYEKTNPYIHSSQDTMDKLSLEHMTDYLKLATAFVVEMAEPLLD